MQINSYNNSTTQSTTGYQANKTTFYNSNQLIVNSSSYNRPSLGNISKPIPTIGSDKIIERLIGGVSAAPSHRLLESDKFDPEDETLLLEQER